MGAKEAAFSDMVLDGPDERDWEHAVKTQIFVKDHYMVEWAAPRGQWVRDTAAKGDPLWWHKGDFFGAMLDNVSLAIPEPGTFTLFGSGGILLLIAAIRNRRVDRRHSLTEDEATGDCCFLERTPDGKRTCGIYPEDELRAAHPDLELTSAEQLIDILPDRNAPAVE